MARSKATTQFKTEDACIFCNVIKIFWQKKVTKTKKGGPSSPFKLQMALAQSCKNRSTCLCRIQIPQLPKGRIDLLGVNCDSSFI